MIQVLMSTYNGAKFLREQIDSILKQEGVEVRLLVRDDCSTDATQNILDEYKRKLKLSWYTGPNLGAAASFMKLLADSPDADYYAFADQDDLWLPQKLRTAADSIADVKGPALYYGQPQPATINLTPDKKSGFHPLNTFGESLVYWYAMGCTMVMNRALRDIINTYTVDSLYMHDVWIFSIAQAVGAYVVWDGNPQMLNRQHRNNVVGLNASFTKMLKLRLNRFFKSEHVRSRQAEELLKGYSEYIKDENRLLLQNFIYARENLYERIKLVADSNLRCSDKTTQILFWISLITNKY